MKMINEEVKRLGWVLVLCSVVWVLFSVPLDEVRKQFSDTYVFWYHTLKIPVTVLVGFSVLNYNKETPNVFPENFFLGTVFMFFGGMVGSVIGAVFFGIKWLSIFPIIFLAFSSAIFGVVLGNILLGKTK